MTLPFIILLLHDSFSAAFVFGFSSELIFDVMVYFNIAPAVLIAALTLIASLSASMFNWGLGSLVRRVKAKAPLGNTSAAKLPPQIKRYGMFLLLFSPIDGVGEVLTLLAGAAHVKFLHALLLVLAARSAYYTSFILLN